MKLTLPRKELSAALGIVKTAAGRNGTLPILGHVAVVANTKSVTLTATDLDIAVRLRTEANVKDEGKTSVRAYLLADIANNTIGDDITLHLRDERLHLAAGESKFELSTLPIDEFPPFPAVKDAVELDLSESGFRGALAAVSFAASTDESRFVLNGIFLEGDGEHLNVVATDGRRIARAALPVDANAVKGVKCILPTKAVKELLRLLSGDPEEQRQVQLRIGKTQVEFRFGDIVLASKLIEGDYPNYRAIIPTPAAGKVTQFGRADLLGCAERVNLVADGVTLELDGSTLGIKSCLTGDKKDATGKATDALLTACKQKLTVSLATRYLIDALKATNTDEVDFYVDGKGIALITVPNDRWLCAIATLKV